MLLLPPAPTGVSGLGTSEQECIPDPFSSKSRTSPVWDSIALHTTASIAQHKGTDVACCQNGIACDYGGLGYHELSADNRKVILSAYPRLDMKNMLTTCLCGIAKSHPNTTRDNFIADFGLQYIPGYRRVSSVDLLHQAPFVE
jgi:hypothetical protein